MSKFVDAIIGHAIGDAMGTPVEFFMRKNLKDNKVTEMLGNIGQHNEPVGSWSDDTAMELALIDSIINKKEFDYDDIMDNFVLWIENGKYTPLGHAFGVGRGCLKAIYNYKKGVKSLDCGSIEEQHMSNGSLMRILPVALYSYKKQLSMSEIQELVNNVSSLTHRQDAVKLACYMYVMYVIDLLNGIGKDESYENMRKRSYNYNQASIDMYSRLLKDDIRNLNIDDINSSGYIVDTIEASFWCLLKNNSYRDTVIEAINLGQDTDTIGAIVGSMAGIIYGYSSIPESWIDKLLRKEYLINLALDFEKLVTDYRKDVILGTIIGDVSGSRFEILNTKNRDFEFFHKNCHFTDDSVMTLAVAKAFLDLNDDYSDFEKKIIETMTELGRKYPNCGYGPSFRHWIMSDEHKPYGSFGNGAAMRISAVGVVAKNISEIKKLSAIVTNVSHNHSDSIIGSEATAVAIHLALNGKSKEEIKEYIESNYFMIYDLRKDTMKLHEFHINCVETVKQSIGAFIDSDDFEDAIRNAIALGGDSDTIAAITGGIAAAYYGIPDDIYNKVLEYLDDYLIGIHDNFYKKYGL